MASVGGGTVVAGPWASQWLITSLAGPIYVGFGVSSVVHGLFIGQSMRVWRHVELSKRYRAFLILISVLLFAYGAVIVEENCWWGVRQKRSFEDIIDGSPMSNVPPILGGFIAAACQAALALRASALFASSKRRWIFLSAVGLVIGAEFAAGALMITVSGILYITDEEDRLGPYTFKAAVATYLCTAAAIDIVITAALYLNLRRMLRKGGGFSASTDGIIRQLINLALRTAAYTTVLAICGAGFALGIREDNLKLTDAVYAFYLPLPGLYCLALFTTALNRPVHDKLALPPSLVLTGAESLRPSVSIHPHHPLPFPRPRARRSSLFDDEDSDGEGDSAGVRGDKEV